MNKTIIKALVIAIPLTLAGISCKKDKTTNTNTDSETLKKEILSDVSNKVCKESYEDMYTKSLALLASVETLNTTTNDANLAISQAKWKDMRTTWEQTEAWLFGPIAAEEIDPRIDTWPVDFNALEDILSSDDDLTEAYVDDLEESLKGFHPIEYLLWGQNGTKAAASFTPREKEYLLSLTQNLVKLTKEVRDIWTTGGYTQELALAGQGSTEFTTRVAAYVQIVDAMAGICEEVATGKIKEPFDAADAGLEESPFAKNSLTDFTNNIKGVLAAYQGRFINDGKGLEDLVRANNLSLDAEVKAKHAAAIAALADITVPFGDAITTQQSKVQNAMDKIGDLQVTLETKLKPFLQQYAK
ncbi:MAG: imelysin family protein [Mucilaginibacter sp.]